MSEPAHSARSHSAKGTQRPKSDTRPAADWPCLATVDIVADGDRTSVTVRGELDLDAVPLIRSEMHEALHRSGSAIDLDLRAVGFCDCSGLNLLLELRQRALRQGKTVAIRAASPPVGRLLELTGTRQLFAHPAPDAKDSRRPGGHDTNACHDADQDLRSEVSQLRRAMRTRPTIDLARGILMATFGLSPEAAWNVLVTTSQTTNTKLHRLASALVSTVHGATLPPTVQAHLRAAVTGTNAASAAPANGRRRHRGEPARHLPFSGRLGQMPAGPGRADTPSSAQPRPARPS
ncbi:anti-sigma factor antagonist [Streptomyces sp. Y2F8-2]|uniref:anti-sigma factor antagonist n=1 Tax=Streptomyces sp. Y2F8-2 TaxID=2759675 RepID=UPI001904906D|nr:anti-sigma factor antagonist [Streptomyces sp. Y2F8-2]